MENYKMRVGFSGFVFDHGKSGIGTYIKSLLKAFSKLDSDDTYDLFFENGDEKMVSGLDKRFTWNLSPSWVAKPIPNIVWHNAVLPILSYARKYDVVHIPSFRRIPLIKGSAKLVATVHDMAPLALAEKYDPLRTFYHRHVQARIIHRCDRVIAVSSSTKADIIKFTGYPDDKIDVIYSGYDKFLYKPVEISLAQQVVSDSFGISDPYFVYVSRIEHPGKNHCRLIEAFELFKKKTGFSHHLIFAGSDWKGAEIVKAKARASPYKKNIHFLGFVTEEVLPSLYSACEAMVYPSLYEGFGLPLIEAMACGALVLASNTSSLQEVGGPFSRYFDPTDVQQIAQMLEDGCGCASQHRQQRIDYASKFTWESAAKQVLEVYKR